MSLMLLVFSCLFAFSIVLFYLKRKKSKNKEEQVSTQNYGMNDFNLGKVGFKERLMHPGGIITRPYKFIPLLVGWNKDKVDVQKISDFEWRVGDPSTPGGWPTEIDDEGDWEQCDTGFYEVCILTLDRSPQNYGIEVNGNAVHDIEPQVKELIREDVVNYRGNIGKLTVDIPSEAIGIIHEEVKFIWFGDLNESKGRLNLDRDYSGVERKPNKFIYDVAPFTNYLDTIHSRDPRYKRIVTLRYLTDPISKGNYGLEVYNDSGKVILNSNNSSALRFITDIEIDARVEGTFTKVIDCKKIYSFLDLSNKYSYNRIFLPNSEKYAVLNLWFKDNILEYRVSHGNAYSWFGPDNDPIIRLGILGEVNK
ncbi:hypothetical protein ACNO7M_02890 [Bisgaard Taxon 45]